MAGDPFPSTLSSWSLSTDRIASHLKVENSLCNLSSKHRSRNRLQFVKTSELREFPENAKRKSDAFFLKGSNHVPYFWNYSCAFNAVLMLIYGRGPGITLAIVITNSPL